MTTKYITNPSYTTKADAQVETGSITLYTYSKMFEEGMHTFLTPDDALALAHQLIVAAAAVDAAESNL